MIRITRSFAKHLRLAVAAGAVFVIGSASAAPLTWSGGGGNWDTVTTNWLDAGMAPVAFTNGDAVDFATSSAGTITVTGSVAPLSTTVSAASGTYTFSGGAIAGAGPLTKTGGGQLTISNTNSYTGKTSVQGGTLLTGGAAYLSNAGSAGVFGAPPAGPDATIDLYNEVTLRSNGSSPRMNQSTDRSLNLAGTGAGTVSIRYNDNDASLTFGGVTATGTGAKLLKIDTGINGNGDREAIIFTGGIADSSDSSPTSVAVTFNTQGSPNWVSLNGVNTFTGPITLTQINGSANGVLVIGGFRAAGGSGPNTVGTGSLGSGNYPGAITLGTRTVLEYDSTSAQTLAGAISGPGALLLTGSGQVTLTGPNTYSGNTTVNGGSTLELASTGGMTFLVTNTTANKVTGGGTANLDGTFTIVTSAVTSPIASWTLADATTKSFTTNFNVSGFDDTDLDDVWTKEVGFATWTFTEATGVLSVNTLATITSFGIPGYDGVIDNNALTIALSVPYGTDLATLAPDFTVTSGTVTANGNAVSSGSPPNPDFSATNPATYTVTDGAAVSSYAVTVTVAPAPPAGVGAGLVAWFDASVGTTTDGSGVVTWDDQSGNGHTATRAQGTMQIISNEINGLPAVQFGDNTYAPMLGTMYSKTQFIVTRMDGGDWGAWMGSQVRSGYMWNQNGNCWDQNVPAAVSKNGTALGAYPFYLGDDRTSQYMILKIVGNDNNTSQRLYELGRQEGWLRLKNYMAEIITYDRVLTTQEEAAVGYYLAQKYAVATAYAGPASIISFGIPDYPATIDQGAKTIALTVPDGTDLATLAPTFELNSGSCDQTSGSTPSPTFAGGPVTYTVTDGATVNPYTVTVTVLGPFPAPTPPPVTADMRVWLTADNVNTADTSQTRVSGPDTFVTKWKDLSGNLNHASNATESQQPQYIASTLNGKPVIRFAQVDDNNGSRLFLGDLSAQFGAPVPDPYPTAVNSGAGGASLDGTYIDTPTRGVTGALVGDSNTATFFTGVLNQRVVIPWSAALNPATAGLSDPFTAEAWVKSNGAPGGSHVIVQSMRSPGQFGTVNDIPNDRSGWFLRQNGADLVFGVGTPTGAPFYYYYTVAGVVSGSEWQHIAVVYDGDETPVIYVDKVAQSYVVTRQDGDPFNPGEEAAIRVLQNTDCPEIIGDRGFGGWRFNGVIDEVAIYPSALSAGVIESHFDNGVAAVPATPYATLVGSSNPAGYYRLDEPAAPVSAQAATIFAVTTLDNDLQYSVFGNRNNDERWVGGNYSEVTPGAFRGGRANYGGTYGLMPHTGSHIFSYESDSTAYNFLLNGTLIGTTGGDYNSGIGLNWAVGNNAAGNGAQLKGDIAELIIYNRILSPAEATAVGAYLANKYGLDTAYNPAGGNDYVDWIAGFSVGGLTAFGDDADGDGNANGVENFLGTDPSVFTAGLSAGVKSGNTFTFTHPQNATPADDITAAYQWSTDLATFNADGATVGATTVDFSSVVTAGIATVTATITGTVPDALFANILVTSP